MDRVYLGNALGESVTRVLSGISRLSVSEATLVTTPEGPLVHTRLQTIFNLRYASPLDRLLHEMIMMHALSAERAGPSGFDRCIEVLLEGFRLLERGTTLVEVKKRLGGGPVTVSDPPTVSDLEAVIERYLYDPQVRAMIRVALDLAGFNGNVSIERAIGQRGSVEGVRGYTFKLSPSIPVVAYVENPRIVCIDGYIEAVAEVHHLLEAAAERKEPVIMFVRGMSDDVRHTLRVNYDRGSLRVVPVTVPFDFDGINTLADVCAVTGADLVTSAKGDLISGINLGSAVRVRRVSIFRDRVIIHEGSTWRAVNAQVAKLRELRSSAEHDVKSRLFDRRIRSLSPNHVTIRLPDDRLYVQRAQSVDYTLRALAALINHGTVLLPTGERVPAATYAAGGLQAIACLETIAQAGAAVIMPPEGLAGPDRKSAA